MSDDRGQALIMVAALLAIAAVVVAGLRLSQDVILANAMTSRAGEAAVEAATAVVADAYAAELRRAAIAKPQEQPDIARILGDPALREDARAAASDLSIRNGGDAVDDVSIACGANGVAVTLVLAHVSYEAGFRADECSPR